MRSFVLVLFVIISTLLSQAQRSYAKCDCCSKYVAKEYQTDCNNQPFSCDCACCSEYTTGDARGACGRDYNCFNGKRPWNQELWQLEKRNKPISIEEILRRLIE